MKIYTGAPEIKITTFTKPLNIPVLFSNTNPVWLEIGFGVGNFLLELAKTYPSINFMGIEHNKSRYRRMAEKIVKYGIRNIKIMDVDAQLAVQHLLEDESIDRIFIQFPDPWPKNRHEKYRLFNMDFVRNLAKCLKQGGKIRVLTDAKPYFQYITTIMFADDLFSDSTMDGQFPVTTFEQRFIRKNIPYYEQIAMRV
jgi:tRNA (guanine-N7-)-methyltransferase